MSVTAYNRRSAYVDAKLNLNNLRRDLFELSKNRIIKYIRCVEGSEIIEVVIGFEDSWLLDSAFYFPSIQWCIDNSDNKMAFKVLSSVHCMRYVEDFFFGNIQFKNT